MGLIVIVVFIGSLRGCRSAVCGQRHRRRQAGSSEMLARLDSALATGKSKSDMSDLLVDVRKSELLSTIPWIDKILRQVELTPRLRRLLYQADLKWTVGGLLMMCVGAFAFCPAIWFTGAPATSSSVLLIGAGLWLCPYRLCDLQAQQADGQV